MTTSQDFPPEIVARVCDILAEEHLESALLKMALVSQRWLHQSRRSYFLKRRISLETQPSKKYSLRFQNLLLDSDSACTFWPYMLDISILKMPYHSLQLYGSAAPPIFSYYTLALRCIAKACNLHTIRLDGFPFSESINSRLTTVETLTSIHLSNIQFPSPVHFCTFLSSLPHLRHKCVLVGIAFAREILDISSLPRFEAHPSLRFKIHLVNSDSYSLLDLVMHYRWNVTNLIVDYGEGTDPEFALVQEALWCIGPSLRKLNLSPLFIGKYNNTGLHSRPFDLKHNTSLELLDIGRFDYFTAQRDVPPTDWLVSLLTTVTSKGRFRSLRGDLGPGHEKQGLSFKDHWRVLFDGPGLRMEKILSDKSRFQGEGPTVTFVIASKGEAAIPIVRNGLPGLDKEERLEFWL